MMTGKVKLSKQELTVPDQFYDNETPLSSHKTLSFSLSAKLLM